MNRRISPDSVTCFLLFIQYDFVVGLLQGFVINAHESGSNSPGVGTLSSVGILPGLEKSISPLFPGPRGTWLQMTIA